MKPGGNGKSRIFTDEEMDLLFEKGFNCARDRALFALSRYTGGRPLEITQMFYTDAFIKDSVQEKILLRKAHTKGKQATRIIKIHARAAQYLKEYYQDSLDLLRLKKTHGNWIFLGLRRPLEKVQCNRCGSTYIVRDGLACYSQVKQMYECKDCNYHFTGSTVIQDASIIDSRYENTDEYLRLGVKSSSSYGFLFLDEKNPYLFPGAQGKGHICYQVFHKIFEDACQRVGIFDASPYSFRRTFLTRLHNNRVPLRVIQELSGHRSLGALQRYLEVSDEQISVAIKSLPF